MVHPQRTSDEKRPGRGRQRINPREFTTTGPRTRETAANYLLHRDLRQDGGGDQRGVSYVALLSAAQTLYEKKGYGKEVDPWMTLIGYFNSMRELGGMRRLVDDDVRTRLGKMEQRGLTRRFISSVDELTSRKNSTDIPDVLDHLEVSFDPQTEAKRKELAKRGHFKDLPKRPLDVLLATNMVSVGVDVQRLGLMVLGGQPKTTAEYIQATSRVGRRFQGLVFTVYN